MRYHVLACDYDGTIAHHGFVAGPMLAALERLRATGRKLILVTGRELEDLFSVFPQVELFERIVGENGGLIYQPSNKAIRLLAPPPPETFVQELKRRGVAPMSVGRTIVATWVPHEKTVLDVIRDQGLELHVIFNKDAVMVLPTGVNKATGLAAALKELGLSPHEVVGVGDAENDHAFLALCECSAAVANALPAVKERADLVTAGGHGDGVTELVDLLVKNDLASLEPRLIRHHLLLGTSDRGEVRLPPYGINLLIAGPSGSGKSTAASSVLERLVENKYQFCIIDPEGDYEGIDGALTIGSAGHPPAPEEVLRLLAHPGRNVAINLIGMSLADRPPFFVNMLPRLLEMRARTGRPHWLIIDEAHHLLPQSWEPGPLVFPQELKRSVFITVHPDQVAASALKTVDTVIAVGNAPEDTLRRFCTTAGERMPSHIPEATEGKVVLWQRGSREAVQVQVNPSKSERRRHVRKYAEGELPPERSFYFRGPKGALNLRAQNLILFMQVADGVDDDTWTFHLRNGDYSQWFREKIKDEELAGEVAEIEAASGLSPVESRAHVKEAIMRRYTLPATAPLPMPGTDAKPTRQVAGVGS